MIELRHKSVLDDRQIKDAYDELYQERSLSMPDAFYWWILDLLAPPANSVLVDVACGNGRLVELAVQRQIKAIGVDLSYTGIAETAARAPQAYWACCDGQTLPLPTASVDTVVSSGSLEHYADPLQGVQEIARILKPGGKAFVLLPNAYGLLGNILHVARAGEVFDDQQPLQRYATRGTWQQMLRYGGLNVERVIPYWEADPPRSVADLVAMVGKPQKIVRLLLALTMPVNWANQLVFLCRTSSSVEETYYPTLPAWSKG